MGVEGQQWKGKLPVSGKGVTWEMMAPFLALSDCSLVFRDGYRQVDHIRVSTPYANALYACFPTILSHTYLQISTFALNCNRLLQYLFSLLDCEFLEVRDMDYLILDPRYLAQHWAHNISSSKYPIGSGYMNEWVAENL